MGYNTAVGNLQKLPCGGMTVKEKLLYGIWLCMYIICVGMGSIVQRGVGLIVLLNLLALLFFAPGVVLLVDGMREQNRKQLLRVRIVSLTSLVLTLCLIVLNILLVGAGEQAGEILHDVLMLVSTPMFCCYWQGVSLFLWACLFVGSFPGIWKK